MAVDLFWNYLLLNVFTQICKIPENSLNFLESFIHKSSYYFHFLDEFVAQFKSTLLLLPNGTVLATGIPIDVNQYESEHKIENEDMIKLLAENPNVILPSSSSKNKKKKKKPSSGAGKENEAEEKAEA